MLYEKLGKITQNHQIWSQFLHSIKIEKFLHRLSGIWMWSHRIFAEKLIFENLFEWFLFMFRPDNKSMYIVSTYKRTIEMCIVYIQYMYIDIVRRHCCYVQIICVRMYACMYVCLICIQCYEIENKVRRNKYGVSASILVPLSKHSSGFDYIL